MWNVGHMHACLHHRDPPEPTGDEPEGYDFEAPKIYEHVRFFGIIGVFRQTLNCCFIPDTSVLRTERETFNVLAAVQ